ncbi:hypothetical protein [Piscinibacter sp. XHJ-5]|uniref:P-type ATPase n=1 Tax=Piscinibacter sp. XHJ-5 TaxID=3037797 RepID=UPI0024529208|nr:hypothetical protein [Piscinibacter sp. XHJ-5]
MGLPATEVVPGDIVRLTLGAAVPADATMVTGAAMIDSSMLTGESLPVEAGLDTPCPAACGVADRGWILDGAACQRPGSASAHGPAREHPGRTAGDFHFVRGLRCARPRAARRAADAVVGCARGRRNGCAVRRQDRNADA